MGHAFYWQVGLHSRTLVDIEIFSIRRSTLTTTHVNLVMLNSYFSLCMVIITWMQWSQHCGHKLINDTMFRPTLFFCLLTLNLLYCCEFVYLQHIFALVCLYRCIFSQALYQMCLPCICMSILQDLGISLLTIIVSFKIIIV